MLVNTNKRKTAQGYLFPGERLKKRTRHHFELTPWIGYAFEQMTANVLLGECLTVNCEDDCCPDVQIDKFTLVESKASCRGCFVSSVRQFENYRYLRNEDMMRVYYALWEYERTKDRPKTIQAALEDCAYRVRRLILLDFPIVEMLVAECSRMYYITSQRGKVAYYRVRRAVYKPVADDPEAFLKCKSLAQYHVKRRKVKSTFSVDGVKFKSAAFDMVTVEESIPF